MKAELVKRQDRWDLYIIADGSKIASTSPNPMNKLSIKNCQAIELFGVQQNGWEVEILKELDKDGCLILKRI